MNHPLPKINIQSPIAIQRNSDLQMSLLIILVSLISVQILAGGPLLFLALLDSPLFPSLIQQQQRSLREDASHGFILHLLCVKVHPSSAEKRILKLLKQLMAPIAFGDCPSLSQLHPPLHTLCPITSLLVGTLHGHHEPQSGVPNDYQSMMISGKPPPIHTKANKTQMSSERRRIGSGLSS